MHTKTSFPDKSALTALYEDKLLECLEKYDPCYGAKFITYYSRCLDNALINFNETVEVRRTSILSLDYEYDNETESDFHELVGEEDRRFEDLDTLLYFETISKNLDENERRVCQVILANHHKLTYKEIAKEIGLTIAAIPNILGRLRKKFNNSNTLAENFAKSL